MNKTLNNHTQEKSLGGPAKVFEEMTQAIKAGQKYEDVLNQFGFAECTPSCLQQRNMPKASTPSWQRSWDLDSQTAKFLADIILANDEPTAITLSVGFVRDNDGNTQHGLRLQESEYREEGAILLVESNPTRPIEHLDDVATDRFAAAMKEKLALARTKGRGGWENCDPSELSAMLREHVEKGDPLDVANFCMFLWNLQQPISTCTTVQAHSEGGYQPVGSRQATNPPSRYPNGPLVQSAEKQSDFTKSMQKTLTRFEHLPEGSKSDYERAKPTVAVNELPLTGRWHHGNGVIVSGTIRIARWDCDTCPPKEFRDEVLDWICEALNASIAAAEKSKGGCYGLR